MRRKPKFSIPAKYLLLILTFLCVVVMFISLTLNLGGGPLNTIAGYIIIPMQQGINTVGAWITDQSDYITSLNSVLEENKELQAEVERLTEVNNDLKLDQYKQEEWYKLYEEQKKYTEYQTVAAEVISKSGGNWFDEFMINKGSNDGIEIDHNVIAAGGLAGIVIDVGPHYAKVRSIIHDISNVSGMTRSTQDSCIVSGDLRLLNEDRVIRFEDLKCKEGEIAPGEEIITTYFSDKFLPDLVIGQVQSIEKDSNNLTCSGTLTTTVDFEHLRDVLIILKKKEQIKE